MKKEKRQDYRNLISASDVGFGLCNFCKFAEWEGGSCCDSDIKCTHQLQIINEVAGDVWEGSDCWAYRPDRTFSEIAEVVGIYLQGCYSHKNKNGELVAIIPSESDKAMGF